MREWAAYRWSSYPASSNQAPGPAWLCRELTYATLGHRQRYAAYRNVVAVGVGVDEEMTRFYGKAAVAAVLGDQAFREGVARRKHARDGSDVREGLRARPPLAAIVKAIAFAFGVVPNQMTEFAGRGTRANVPRKVAMYYGQNRGGMPLQAIAEAFGLSHVGGVSSAIAAVKARLAEKDVARAISKIEKRLHRIKLT